MCDFVYWELLCDECREQIVDDVSGEFTRPSGSPSATAGTLTP